MQDSIFISNIFFQPPFTFNIQDIYSLILQAFHYKECFLYFKIIKIRQIMGKYNLVVLLLFLDSCLTIPLTIHRQSFKTGARCLDGSQAALYYAEGQQRDKTIIYFQGGGYCDGLSLETALQNCFLRFNTQYGSSRTYPQFFQSNVVSLLSSDNITNPLYHDWNKVIIPYCDGSLHQGSSQKPVMYKNLKLYFRGSNNTLAHFSYLNRRLGLYKSSQIVLSGSSSGGIAVFYWGNHLQKILHSQSKLILISDSGIIFSSLDTPKTQTIGPNLKSQTIQNSSSSGTSLPNANAQLPGIFSITNFQTKHPLQQCVKDHPEQVPCFFTENLAKYIIPPIFILQSLYDVYGLRKILNISCISQGLFSTIPSNLTNCSPIDYIIMEMYRQKSVNVLKQFSSNSKNAVWGISCFIHTFLAGSIPNSQNWVAPIQDKNIKQKTIMQALQDFMEQKEDKQWIDHVSYPNNLGCNGIIRKK